MTGGVEEATLAAVGRIVTQIEADGVRCALVGAAALAAHDYNRATEDIDIGVAVPVLAQLEQIAVKLRALLGFAVDVALPDSDDPLGGVITITDDSIIQIQIVNFINPLGIGDHPGREAIATAAEIAFAGARVRVVDVAHLVAMKLAAGGQKSRGDVVELLRHNPEADLGAIGALCDRFRLGDAWRALLPEIEANRAR